MIPPKYTNNIVVSSEDEIIWLHFHFRGKGHFDQDVEQTLKQLKKLQEAEFNAQEIEEVLNHHVADRIKNCPWALNKKEIKGIYEKYKNDCDMITRFIKMTANCTAERQIDFVIQRQLRSLYYRCSILKEQIYEDRKTTRF